MIKNEELLNLLNFDHCCDKVEILERASVIAHEMMQNWKIVTPKGVRRFLGLEFYLYIPEIFEDDATHRRCEQLQRGTFYFHTKSKGSWTPPIFNRHGLDITCGSNYGNKEQNIYGGILLRHLGGEGHRDGSGLALRSLVRGDDGFKPITRGSHKGSWAADEVAFFKRMNDRPVFGNEMYLDHDPLNHRVEIEAVARVGIGKTKYAKEKLGFVSLA